MKRWSPLGRETVTSLGFKWVKYLLNIYIEDMYIVYNTSYIYTYIHVDTYIYSFQICYIYILYVYILTCTYHI